MIAIENLEADEALSQVLPILESAKESINQMSKNDIVEIRSFTTPPESVQIVCECIAILKGYKEISWKTAKSMMGESGFLKNLQEMNCDIITAKQISMVKTHMKVFLVVLNS